MLRSSLTHAHVALAASACGFFLASCGAEPAFAPHPPPPAAASAASPATPSVVTKPVGVVIDASGEPVSGAVVAATSVVDWDADAPTALLSESDAKGEVRFADLPAGSYRLTASTSAGWAALPDPIVWNGAQSGASASLTLQATGFEVRGVALDELGQPVSGAAIEALPLLPTDAGPAFASFTNARGQYVMRLPNTSAYLLIASVSGRKRAFERASPKDAEVDLELPSKAVPRPDDETLRAWLSESALPIRTDSPQSGLDDLAPIAAWVGDASLIGLGEGTHGTAEFSRLKHRLIALLAAQRGFSVVAFECGVVEAREVDRFVREGKGDAEAVVRKLGSDPFITEEVVSLVRWMREYNRDKSHPRKLSFAGFDLTTWTVVSALQAYVARVGKKDAAIGDALDRLAGMDVDMTYAGLAPEVHEATRTALLSLQAWLRDEHAGLAKKTGEEAFLEARDHAARLAEAERSFLDPTLRDVRMAEEVERLRKAHPGERVALWLHNAHASAWARPFDHMGARLRQKYGKDYVSVGFTFGDGSLRALKRGSFESGPIEHSIKRPAEGSLESALALGPAPIFAIDLRGAKAPMRSWLGSPLVVTESGFVFNDEESARRWTVPLRAYDIVIHVAHTSAAHGLPKRGAGAGK